MKVLFSAATNSPAINDPRLNKAYAKNIHSALTNAFSRQSGVFSQTSSDRFDHLPALKFGLNTNNGTGELPPTARLYAPGLSIEKLYGIPSDAQGAIDAASGILKDRKYPVNQMPDTAKDQNYAAEKKIIEDFGESGLLSIGAPEEIGGGGHNIYASSELARYMGYYDLGLATTVLVSSAAGLYGMPLVAHGTPEQQQRFLEPIMTGEKIGAFALTETDSGSDAGAMKTKAVPGDDGLWHINGNKMFITNGSIADYILVEAISPDGKTQAFIVDGNAPGLTAERLNKMGQHASDTASLTLTDVKVEPDRLIGEDPSVGIGKTIYLKTLEGGRVGVAAMSSGAMQRALDEAVKYVKEREQWRNPLDGHKEKLAEKLEIREMLAGMALTNEIARLMVYDAARASEVAREASGPDKKKADAKLRLAASMAKLYASEGANKVAYDSLQLHGGYGFMREYPISKIYDDLRVMTIYEGTSQIQKQLIQWAMAELRDLPANRRSFTGLDDIIQQGVALTSRTAQARIKSILAGLGKGPEDKAAMAYAANSIQDVGAKLVKLVTERKAGDLLVTHLVRLRQNGATEEDLAVAAALMRIQRFKTAQLAIATAMEINPTNHYFTDMIANQQVWAILAKAAHGVRADRNLIATALTGIRVNEMDEPIFDLTPKKKGPFG